MGGYEYSTFAGYMGFKGDRYAGCRECRVVALDPSGMGVRHARACMYVCMRGACDNKEDAQRKDHTQRETMSEGVK